MSLDDRQRAGISAPQSKLPYALAALLALAAIGAAVWFLLGRQAETPAGNLSNAAAPVADPPGRGERLASGLRFETVREGNGALITRADAVLLRYEMRVVGGPVIDGNMDAAQGNAMSLNQVIPGFAEGLARMRPGGIARFWVPPQLGYGTNIPPGAPFGPNDTLEFLVRIEQVAPGRAAELEAGPAQAGNAVLGNDVQGNSMAARGGR